MCGWLVVMVLLLLFSMFDGFLSLLFKSKQIFFVIKQHKSRQRWFRWWYKRTKWRKSEKEKKLFWTLKISSKTSNSWFVNKGTMNELYPFFTFLCFFSLDEIYTRWIFISIFLSKFCHKNQCALHGWPIQFDVFFYIYYSRLL